MQTFNSFNELAASQTALKVDMTAFNTTNGLNDMVWQETPNFKSMGSAGKKQFSLRYHYVDPVDRFIYGEVEYTWTPSEDNLKELGITPDMNWYELRNYLNEKAEAMARNNPDPNSITTTFYPNGYRPSGACIESSPNYKSGKSNSIDSGKAKIEKMTAKARQQ